MCALAGKAVARAQSRNAVLSPGLASAHQVSDQVIMMYVGKVIETGTKEAII